MVKNPPVNAGDAVSVPGGEDALEDYSHTPIVLPGKSRGPRNVAESDVTELPFHK